MLETVVYELVGERGVNTEADSCAYRDRVLLDEEIVAKDIRLSLSDILSVDDGNLRCDTNEHATYERAENELTRAEKWWQAERRLRRTQGICC
jgi:hypothetical protein